MQNRIKSRKYCSIHQYQNFRNFNIKHLQWSKADLPKEKKDSKERHSTNFSSSRPEVYTKKGVLKKIRHLFIGISLKFMIFITFKTRKKTCLK